jgi:hypothetical protein
MLESSLPWLRIFTYSGESCRNDLRLHQSLSRNTRCVFRDRQKEIRKKFKWGNVEGKRPLARRRRKWEDSIKVLTHSQFLWAGMAGNRNWPKHFRDSLSLRRLQPIWLLVYTLMFGHRQPFLTQSLRS